MKTFYFCNSLKMNKLCVAIAVLSICFLDYFIVKQLSSQNQDCKKSAPLTNNKNNSTINFSRADLKNIENNIKESSSLVFLPENGIIRFESPPTTKPSVRILFWNELYGAVDHWLWWFKKDSLKNTCPDVNCIFSINKTDLNASDAVVLTTFSYSINWTANIAKQLPPWRQPHQRWIFFMIEPPSLKAVDHRPLNGLFNWTATYKLDSDIVVHFGKVVLQKQSTNSIVSRNYAKEKKRLVSWMVSHCSTEGNRMEYVKELKKYIPVDIYGKCGNLTCSKDKNCYQELGRRYKFYLAFENIICKDYVSEKFINALANDMVPVVFGGADYNKFAPLGSFIDALKFNTPKQLAEYLLYLDKNDKMYNKYFTWKNGYSNLKAYQHQLWICDLCIKLMDPKQPVKVYKDLHGWWNSESNCSSWNHNKINK